MLETFVFPDLKKKKVISGKQTGSFNCKSFNKKSYYQA